MKIKTRGFVRAIVSIIDYVKFYEITLAKSGRKLMILLGVYVALVLVSFMFRAKVWQLPTWATSPVFINVLPWLMLSMPVLMFLINLQRADRKENPHFLKNKALENKFNAAQPSVEERKLGFKTIKSGIRFQSSIAISKTFNMQKIFNPDVDWPLILKEDSEEYDRLITSLKDHSNLFVPYGRAKLRKALFGKQLINEDKIAFASNFPPENDDDSITVYKTNYFTGMCSAERSRDDAYTETVRGGRKNVSSAESRLAFIPNGTNYIMPDIADNYRPVSLQFGIEVIGLTKDKILRIPHQSDMPEIDAGLRIPLATGSMDWVDATSVKTLNELIVMAAKRELIEEWGGMKGKAGKSLRKRMANSVYEPLGYYRQVLRSGKPQFVCLVYLDCLDSELTPDLSEVKFSIEEYRKGISNCLTPIDSLKSLRLAMKHILSGVSKDGDSVALFGAAQCLLDAIEENPKRVCEILQLDS